MTNFFFNTVKDVMEFRESQNKDGGFNDFMQTLVKLKKEGYTEYEDVKDCCNENITTTVGKFKLILINKWWGGSI